MSLACLVMVASLLETPITFRNPVFRKFDFWLLWHFQKIKLNFAYDSDFAFDFEIDF